MGMKKAEIEQNLKEIHYRLSKMNEKIQALEDENQKEQYKNFLQQIYEQIEIFERKISNLSDELYTHIAMQDQQIIKHIDTTAADLANRIQ